MAKARAIIKRRKAVRNIRKITKTMQMIATAKFQKALKRAVGTKPYSLKARELVGDLAASLGGNIDHPLLRRSAEGANRSAVLVITSKRGLAGAYNGQVLRTAAHFIRDQEAAGKQIELHVSGKKGVTYFNFQRRPITRRYEEFADQPRYEDVERLAGDFMHDFMEGKLDSVHVIYMNFISTSTQVADVLTLLPLTGVAQAADHSALQAAQADAQQKAGALDAQRSGAQVKASASEKIHTVYEFSPGPRELLDELLPLTVKTALFQCFLDAATSENVARMVAMKSATDNADKMVKSLTMQYNRARQGQITTELSEIMGGVEAMKA
jgi:F-type H+-transporting ATPase subunit gamma